MSVGLAPANASGPADGERRDGPPCARRAALPGIVGLIVFLVSLGVRLTGLDLYGTTDEAYWVQRSIRFGAALARGDLASTFRAGHPGVTVMWAGILGMGFDRAAPYFGERFTAYEALEREPTYLELQSAARRAVACAASLLIAAAVLLAWRLFGPGPALAGGTVLTLDPYVIGMTRLLHVDALLAPLMTVAVLAGLVYWTAAPHEGRRWPYLLLSLVAGGLGLLTKTPAVFVAIFLALVCFVTALGSTRRRGLGAGLHAFVPLCWWGAGAAVVFVALFPAIWVDPIGRIDYLMRFVRAVGLQPHDGNFFLGRPVLDDPGPFYYLVAAPLRISPLVALGLALLSLPAVRGERRAAVWWLVAYALLFCLMMSAASKKFDRYLLPALLVADLLAGVGLWRLLVLARSRWPGAGRQARPSPAQIAGLAVMVAVAQAGLLMSVWPHPIAYYNPVAGGAAQAQRLIMVGWGEGLEQTTAYLNGLPNAETLTVVTSYNHVVRPRFAGTTLALAPYLRPDLRASLPTPDYIILYVNAVQRQQIPPEIVHAKAAGPPAFVAHVNGEPYAWVYRVAASPGAGPRPPTPPMREDDTDVQEN